MSPSLTRLLLAGCLSAATLPTSWSQQSTGKATLEGTALNRVTGEGLRNAQLSLRPEANAEITAYETSTSAKGAFQFRGVDPGRYFLYAQRIGFESRYYSTVEEHLHQGTVLMVDANGSLTNLSVKLNPHGAITGRVRDEADEPMPHVRVQALRSIYTHGRRRWISIGEGSTDDLGEYRIFDLAAANYIVVAHGDAQHLLSPKQSFSYVPSYYPNSGRPESAGPVALAPGQSYRGVDFLLRRVPTYSVYGRIAGAGRNVMVYLAPRNAGGMAEDKQPVQVQNGQFEISAVVPGSYFLVAEQFGESGGPASGARVELEVRDSDIRGLDLNLTRGEPIAGSMRVETTRDGAQARTDEASRPVHVSLLSEDGGNAGGAVVDDSNRFQLKGAPPGNYQVIVNNVPAGFYVKSITMADVDVMQRGLDYMHGVSGELTVLLSPNGGTIKGLVKTDSGGKTGSFQVLALASDPRRSKTSLSDQTGHFEISDLAPGDYRILAFEDLEAGASDDAEFMKRFVSKAKLISIKEHGAETVDAIAIPAEQSRTNP